MTYRVFIDESGEAGISKIRNGTNPGASPYFVVGAVVCSRAAEIQARSVLAACKERIGKSSWKHATDLSHADKVLLAREFGRLPVRYFAVISNKATLEEYKDEIKADAQKFYNKCIKYLLERICAYMIGAGAGEDDLSFVLERRNHDYDAMLRYLDKVKANPIYLQSKSLRILNPFSISTEPKGGEDLLEIADFVAHAVYQCTNKIPQNHFIPEPRYFTELSSRFAGNEKGLLLNTGLKCIHDIAQLELDPDIRRLFETTRVKLPQRMTRSRR